MLPLSLLLIDLDDFKQLNDQHGHTAGDDVLIETARRFDEQCRTSELLGRYGGEEFMVLLPETGEEEATQFAQRLVDRARENAIDTVGGDLVVTSSVGVAEAREDETAASLIVRADAPMYQAKSLGKARVHVSE